MLVYPGDSLWHHQVSLKLKWANLLDTVCVGLRNSFASLTLQTETDRPPAPAKSPPLQKFVQVLTSAHTCRQERATAMQNAKTVIVQI